MTLIILPKNSASVLFALLPSIQIDETTLMSLKNEKAINYIKDENVNEILRRYISFEQSSTKKYVYNSEDTILAVFPLTDKAESFKDIELSLLPPPEKKLSKITIYVRDDYVHRRPSRDNA